MLENSEIWKDVKGYEGLYQVSNLGRIWSVRLQRILKPYNANGYFKIDLTAKNGKRKKEYIHRLVALAFLVNDQGYNVVNHIDGNKHNNSVKNLEWCSYSQNSKHSFHTLGNTKGCYSTRRCECIELGIIYNSINDAMSETGANHISECCKGKQKTSGGYHWRYVDADN